MVETNNCFYLYDNAGTYATLTWEHEETGEEQTDYTPPPSQMEESCERELADLPIPGKNRDIGQDMGTHSDEFTITGLCTQTDKEYLKTRFYATQFTVAYPAGRYRLKLRGSDYITYFDRNSLAMKNYRFLYVGGLVKYYRYWITFKCYYGQT